MAYIKQAREYFWSKFGGDKEWMTFMNKKSKTYTMGPGQGPMAGFWAGNDSNNNKFTIESGIYSG